MSRKTMTYTIKYDEVKVEQYKLIGNNDYIIVNNMIPTNVFPDNTLGH